MSEQRCELTDESPLVSVASRKGAGMTCSLTPAGVHQSSDRLASQPRTSVLLFALPWPQHYCAKRPASLGAFPARLRRASPWAPQEERAFVQEPRDGLGTRKAGPEDGLARRQQPKYKANAVRGQMLRGSLILPEDTEEGF